MFAHRILRQAASKAPGSYLGSRWPHYAEPVTGCYHLFSVLGVNAGGTVRTSNPVMDMVRAAAEH